MKKVMILLVLFLIPGVFAANLDLTISTQLNSLVSDFQIITHASADKDFDGFDVPAVPTLSNTAQLYSVICTGSNSNCKLIVDAWHASTNPRDINLEYKVNPGQSGNLVLNWNYDNPDFILILKDYGADSNRVNQVGGDIDLSSQSSYTVSHSGTTRYFVLSVENFSQGNPGDTTPPAPVTNLIVKSNTSNSITWEWTNPTSDFSKAIIYLNGVQVTETSGNTHTASSLNLGSYTLKVHTKDNSNNVNTQDVESTFLLYDSGINPPDTTPPGQITNLVSTNTSNSITWNWINPNDNDFSNVLIYLNGTLVSSANVNTFTASSLGLGIYTLIINTRDNSGNINTNDVSNTRALYIGNPPDITPPAPVTNLIVKSNTSNSITWEWTNPTDSDFSKTIIYRNGVNVVNLSSNVRTYTASSLALGSYTLTVHTMDTNGNINTQNVVSTKSLYVGTTPPVQPPVVPPKQIVPAAPTAPAAPTTPKTTPGLTTTDKKNFFDNNFFGDDEDLFVEPGTEGNGLFNGKWSLIALISLVLLLLIAIIIVIVRIIKTARQSKPKQRNNLNQKVKINKKFNLQK